MKSSQNGGAATNGASGRPGESADPSASANPSSNNGSAPPAAAAQNSGDYSQAWADHYRSIGKIAEAEQIETYIKAQKVEMQNKLGFIFLENNKNNN